MDGCDGDDNDYNLCRCGYVVIHMVIMLVGMHSGHRDGRAWRDLRPFGVGPPYFGGFLVTRGFL